MAFKKMYLVSREQLSHLEDHGKDIRERAEGDLDEQMKNVLEQKIHPAFTSLP